MDFRNENQTFEYGGKRRRWKTIALILAVVIAVTTFSFMVMPALTMEQSMLECQLDLHEHTQECYDEEGNLICGYADFVVHTHDASCYDDSGRLICPLEEIEEHQHTDACYEEVRVLICGQEEAPAETPDQGEVQPSEQAEQTGTQGHTHGPECYTRPLICGMEEGEVTHTHTDACYAAQGEGQRELVCGLEEHTHSDSCYVQGEPQLICGQTEGEGHVHTEACFETPRELTCTLQEHTHTDACYTDPEPVSGGSTLICGQDDTPHVHTDSCYGEPELTCTLQETQDVSPSTEPVEVSSEPETSQEPEQAQQEGHVHTEACYEVRKELICGKEEIILHTHTEECFDEDGNLICGMMEVREHVHDETCLPPTAVNPILQAPNAALRNSVDFTDMITKITLQVQQNGYWVELIGGSVEEGSSLRMRIEFTVAGDTLSDGNRTMHYQLPDGIRLNEKEAGYVDYTDGNPAGSYTIDTDGYIEIVFDDEFDVGQDFSGYLQFEGTVTLADGEEGGTIDFGDVGGSITVVPEEKELDLSITKTGVYDKETNKVAYTITVSSENGTKGEPVHVGDWFQHEVNYGSIRYDENSLKVTKMGGSGTEDITTSVLPNVILYQQDDKDPGWWTIRNLPALGAGESYQISYTATPDLENSGDANGYLEFTNVAGAESGGKIVNASSRVTISQAVIHKEVTSYNQYDRSVTWTIYVRNPDGQDLGGETIEDVMSFWPNGETEPTWEQLPTNVTVTVGFYDAADVNFTHRLSVKTIENVTFPFTFPEGSTGSYSLTYTTQLPEELAGKTGYFNNWAKFLDGEVNVGAWVEIPGLIGYDVVKSFWGEEETEDDAGKTVTALQWGSVVTYPEGATAEDLVFVDLVADAVTGDGTAIPDSHYITAQSLIQGGVLVAPLVGNQWGTGLTMGTDYNVYVLLKDQQPDSITPDSFGSMEFTDLQGLGWLTAAEMLYTGEITSTTPISMIAVVLTDSGFDKLNGNPMVVRYYTVLDTEDLPTGSILTARNLARIPADWTQAEYEERFLERLDKQVSFTGPDMETGDVTSYGDTAAGTIGPDGLIYYRLLLTDFMRGGTGGAEITDVLPAGAELVEGSVHLVGHYQAADQIDWYIEEGNTYYLLYNTEAQGDGTTTLTFTLSHLSDLEEVDVLGIYYAVSVADDPAWGSASSKDYTNTATWDGETDSTTTTVTQELPALKKTGEQLLLDDGAPSNVVRYYVVVNPNGEQLLKETGGTLTLTDTLTVPEGAAAQLLLENAKVCQYNATAEHGIGLPLTEGTYSIQYDGETHTLTVELPDATPCVVVYDYQIDRGGSDLVSLTVDNRATLEGYATTGSDFDIVIKEQSSSAGVNTANLTIYKVNSEDNSELLNDALFRLERYEEQTGGGYHWVNTDITAEGPEIPGDPDGGHYFITGGDGPDGLIILNFLSGEGSTRYEMIYRIKEEKAPDGYLLADDNDYYYFVWMREDKTEQQTIAEMDDIFASAEVSADQVHFIPYNANHSIYIANEPATTSLTVNKQWQNEAGETLTDGLPDNITVTLYQHVDGQKKPYTAEGAVNPVTIALDPETGEWTHTWTGLPKQDENGNPYTYTVEETALNGYETSYAYPEDGNEEVGASSGTITITNTKTATFVLPETGGIGTNAFVWIGVVLMGAALGGCLFWQMRRKEGKNP